MRYVAWILLIGATIWTLGWAHSIRVEIRNSGSLTQQTVNIGMLMAISVLATLLLGSSPFHLLWMFPLAFVLGALSLAFVSPSSLSPAGYTVTFASLASMRRNSPITRLAGRPSKNA